MTQIPPFITLPTMPVADLSNWQGIVAYFRSQVEDEWKTPPIRNTSVYLAEECNEFMSRVNRDMRPFDLRSAPAEEKDDARREAGTAMAMLATLANQLNVFLRPGYLGSRYDSKESGGEGRDALSLAIAINDVGGDISVKLDNAHYDMGPQFSGLLRDDMEILLAMILKAGEIMKFNPFEWMTKFMVSVEHKVVQKRADKQRQTEEE